MKRGIINQMGIMSIIIKIVMMMTWSYKVVSYDHNNCDNTAHKIVTSPAIISRHQVTTIATTIRITNNKTYNKITITSTIVQDKVHYYMNKTNTQSSTIILYNNPTNNK